MPIDTTDSPDFNDAADRLEYEKSRMSEDIRKKVEAIERKAETEKQRLRDEQATNREKDLAAERARQRLEHPAKTYEDLTLGGGSKQRRSEEDIERSTVHAVDHRNALGLMAMDLDCDEKIGTLLGIDSEQLKKTHTPERDTAPQREHDALTAKDIRLDIDFTRAAGPDRGG